MQERMGPFQHFISVLYEVIFKSVMMELGIYYTKMHLLINVNNVKILLISLKFIFAAFKTPSS